MCFALDIVLTTHAVVTRKKVSHEDDRDLCILLNVLGSVPIVRSVKIRFMFQAPHSLCFIDHGSKALTEISLFIFRYSYLPMIRPNLNKEMANACIMKSCFFKSGYHQHQRWSPLISMTESASLPLLRVFPLRVTDPCPHDGGNMKPDSPH